MVKRIEQWLAGIFHRELATLIAEIAELRAEIGAIKAHTEEAAKDVQTHAESVASDLQKHVEQVAANLHHKVATDARAIMQFQQNARLGCSWCGQLSRTYALVDGKIECADCQKKGVA